MGEKPLKCKCCKREEKHICFRLWDGEEGKGRGKGREKERDERGNGKMREERRGKTKEEGVKVRGEG